ncbi:histidine phosphatase family protein [Haploplasma axanthum]|uniref:Alpha-ribazole phosphatase n=1 Tax=Haploplasma axanthum TaxID=29552 RepID=A0A449BEG0_HAPAX|nr:histidine phosphatase family protein [Haploplasma axanthum]VEU80844.1 alpha-ribazole phosphatase [Haploplasma axanthum]
MKIILIRHGEPNYEEVRKWGNIGLGFELAKLTDKGVKQAEDRSKDESLFDADLIISSPYTRALQTAAILSKNLNISLEVETDLHEWFADTKFLFDYDVFKASEEFYANKGILTNNSKYRFEPIDIIRKRVLNVLNKYQHFEKIIVVCHGIVMGSMTSIDDMIEHCGVREIEL